MTKKKKDETLKNNTISIQGDVIGSNIIIGDNNQITVTAYKQSLLFSIKAPPVIFAGRTAELEELLANFRRGTLINGLTGGGGIGKTALARLLAQCLAERYPDGRLEIDLYGASHSGQKRLTPAEAMRGILAPFYPGEKLPDDDNALQNQYASTFNGKRVSGLSQSRLTKKGSSPVHFWFAKTAKRPEKIKMDYSKQEQNEHGLIFDIGSLYEHLLQIEDTRKARGKRHQLITLLVLMLLAKLGGEDTPSGIAEWIANRKTIWVESKIMSDPKTASHMTYRRILQKIISAEGFEEIVQKYHRSRLETGQELMICVDGKTVRGTIPYGSIRGVHLLAVYVPGQGLVLAQAEVDKKENEIVVAPKIISQVLLAGMIVVADAMHTQRAFSSQIVSAGANYVWTVKDNQPRTRWAIQKLFVHEVCNLKKGAPLSDDIRIATTTNKRHGRIEQRTLISSTQLNDYLDWPYVAQVFRIERIVYHAHGRGTTKEIVYGMTSLTPEEAGPEKLLALFREYWKIENSLHYRRDVTFHEDATRLTIGDAGHNMAILNNLAIGLCLQNGYQNVASARRLFQAQPESALALITKK